MKLHKNLAPYKQICFWSHIHRYVFVSSKSRRHERHLFAMKVPKSDMALFGMVWLLRVRAEMKRCAKCQRRNERANQRPVSRATTFFTIEGATTPSQAAPRTPVAEPTTFCEVHGFIPPEEGKIIVFLLKISV